MPHIHTEPGQHDHTASAFIIRTDFDEPKLLLHVHKKLGKLMQPGGHVELHETPWQAVQHEITEETGYKPAQLKILQPPRRLQSLSGAAVHPVAVCQNTHKFNTELNHFHTDTTYAFVTDTPPEGDIAEGESAELRWVGRDELEALNAEQIILNIKEVGLFVFDECYRHWQPVDIINFES
jgi:8-oxo-dGTP pyrophosphatase MutT (NUDIX family)